MATKFEKKNVKIKWEISSIFAGLKLRFSETATKFEKISQAVGRVLVEKSFEDGGCFDTQRPRNAYGFLQDHLK